MKIGPVVAQLLRELRAEFIESFGREPAAGEPILSGPGPDGEPVELGDDVIAARLGVFFESVGLTVENARVAATEMRGGKQLDAVLKSAFRRAGIPTSA